MLIIDSMTCTRKCKSHVNGIFYKSNCIIKHSGIKDTGITNAYTGVVSKFEGKRPLGRSRPRLDNIKMYLKKHVKESVVSNRLL
jgi:hypothetical protein